MFPRVFLPFLQHRGLSAVRLKGVLRLPSPLPHHHHDQHLSTTAREEEKDDEDERTAPFNPTDTNLKYDPTTYRFPFTPSETSLILTSLNAATPHHLAAYGIAKGLGARVLRYRERVEGFRDLSELLEVDGVGITKAEGMCKKLLSGVERGGGGGGGEEGGKGQGEGGTKLRNGGRGGEEGEIRGRGRIGEEGREGGLEGRRIEIEGRLGKGEGRLEEQEGGEEGKKIGKYMRKEEDRENNSRIEDNLTPSSPPSPSSPPPIISPPLPPLPPISSSFSSSLPPFYTPDLAALVTQKRLIKPRLNDDALKNVDSFMALHVTAGFLAWVLCGRDGCIQRLATHPLLTPNTRFDTLRIYEKVEGVVRAMPPADLYVWEERAGHSHLAKAPVGTVIVALQLAQIQGMLTALLGGHGEVSGRRRSFLDEEEEEGEDEDDEGNARLLFLKDNVVPKLFRLKMGNDRLPGLGTADRLMEGSAGPDWLPPLTPEFEASQVYFSTAPAGRRYAAAAVLVAVAFSEVVLKRNGAALMLLSQ